MSTPTPGIVQRSDSTTREEWDTTTSTYRMWNCGVLVVERPFTADELAQFAAAAADATRQANRLALLGQARTAYTNNQTYLAAVAAGTATTATHIAQVPALTRQMQGLIRLIVGSDLLDTAPGDSTAPSRTT